jgi:predicted SnoaL-like aldol condensation-catalyzing enzyme
MNKPLLISSLVALCASSALGVGSAIAADMTPILSNGPQRSANEERANKAMGLMLHRTLFAEGDPQLAADIVMDPQFINHDVEEPSGAQNFADFFLKPKEFGNPQAPRGGGARAASPSSLQRLFIVTDGDLTNMAYPTEGDADPGRRFASNMMEVKNSRVMQWWFSGPTNMDSSPGAQAARGGAAPNGAPPAGGARAGGPPTAPDFSKYYPEMGNVTVGMQSVVPLGAATTREQREANKKVVASFVDEFFNKKNYAIADRLLASDLKNHAEGQPSGAAAFAAYAKANPAKVVGIKTDAVLFTIAEGELVNIGYPVMHNDDPGAWFAQNLMRVKDGRIVEWWFSGYPYGSPREVNPWNKLGYNPRAAALKAGAKK